MSVTRSALLLVLCACADDASEARKYAERWCEPYGCAGGTATAGGSGGGGGPAGGSSGGTAAAGGGLEVTNEPAVTIVPDGPPRS